MKNQSLKNGMTLGALALFAALTIGPMARAQNYGPWSAPVNLNALALSDGTTCPAVVNSPSNDSHPAISPDGLSLFFASTRPGGFGEYDLWVTHRNSLHDCWGLPVHLGNPVNSGGRDFAPNLSNDGHWLFFHSNRTQLDADGMTPCGGQDLYAAHRRNNLDDFGWEPPINLGCTLNTLFDDAGPTFFDDNSGALYLYFTRSKETNNPNSTSFDIYVSSCSADLDTCNRQRLWSPATSVEALNSPSRDTRTAIRRDGLEMIFSSGRLGSVGGSLVNENLWVSTRATTLNQDWSMPVPINCEWQENVAAILNLMLPPTPCHSWAPVDSPGTKVFVNSPVFDGGPALSPDGLTLYFPSERTDLPGSAGPRDLYLSRRLLAVAGPDQTAECDGPTGGTVTLDGSGSSGPDGETLSFAWSDETGQSLGTSARISATFPLGSHTVSLTVADADGLSAQAATHVTVHDSAPPNLTLSKTKITAVIPTASATTMAVSLAGIATATDTCDSNPTLTNDAPAQFPIGVTTVTFTATDHSGNSSQKQLSVQVVYDFSGYFTSILNDGSALYQPGRTLPAKFQLTAADGTFVANAVATLQVFQVLNAPTGTVDMSVNTDPSGLSNTGALFRFDGSQYIYNLSTSGFASGTYLLRATLNDGTTHDVKFSIK